MSVSMISIEGQKQMLQLRLVMLAAVTLHINHEQSLSTNGTTTKTDL